MKKYLLVVTPFVFLLSITEWWYDSAFSESGQLYYVLLFKWKSEVKQAQIAEIDRLWAGLTEKIDGFECYEMNDLVSGDYDQVVVLRFTSQAVYQHYKAHQDHRRISELGPSLVEKFSEFSYWK